MILQQLDIVLQIILSGFDKYPTDLNQEKN